MIGAEMRLTAAGFVVFLLSVSVAPVQTDWRIDYPDGRNICALKGSTVQIRSTYTCTSGCAEGDTKVEGTFWFTQPRYGVELVDLRTRWLYVDRVQYLCENNICTLTITDVRESDSDIYKFRLITNQPGGRYAGTPGVNLTVTDLQVQKSREEWCMRKSCLWAQLKCHSRCLPESTSYIWYKNGEKINAKPTQLHKKDSYSCAVNWPEEVHSPSVCGYGNDCNSVTYSDRRICAFIGSSVDLSCTYNSYYYHATSKFWFRNYLYRQPMDIHEDSQYERRVKVIDNWGGHSTLTISNLIKSDSAEYRFKFESHFFKWTSSLPGITLTVKEPDLEVQVVWSAGPKLICHSSCILSSRPSFAWYKNDTLIRGETSFFYRGNIDPAYSYSCAYENHRTYPVYVPEVPSVSKSFSGEIRENSSLTLTCSSDANPRASYTWYKNERKLPREDPQLVFSSIQSSDSGKYHCEAENQLGRRTSESVFIHVKYAPRLPSVSVSPSAEIVEGSSVNLTCSSDANPAASYTWFKENQTVFEGPEGKYNFPSISSEDSGNYYCKSENQHGEINSTSLFLDVQYAPRLPSVSVSPSAEIVEGSSVTLTCSSDANPAASYTWFKEDEDSPRASGPIFNITEFTAEHSGNYYCEARNSRGRQNSTLHLTVAAGALTSAAAGTISVLLLVVVLLAVFLWIRKNKFFVQQPRGGDRPDTRTQPNVCPVYDVPTPAAGRQPAEQQVDLLYSTVRFSPNREEALYSNITAVRPQRTETEEEEEEYTSVEYTTVKTNSSDPGRTRQEAAEDLFELYSTVN